MPKRKVAARLRIGDQVGGWQVIEELSDYSYPGRRVAYQRVRVECLTCRKTLTLKGTEVTRTACADCAAKLAAEQQPVSPAVRQVVEERIQYRYRVHLKICLALQLAPMPYASYAAELRANPDDELLEDAPSQRETAEYERRDYSPLYNNGAE